MKQYKLLSTYLIILISFVVYDTFAQDYRTIRVNGTILLEKDNKPLETGTIFKEQDDLLFK